MTTGSGGVGAGKWRDRLPCVKYWHAELEAEMAGGSAILASDEDFRSLRHMADFANRVRTSARHSARDFPQFLEYGFDDRPRDGS